MLPREESRPRPTCEDAADVSLSRNYKHGAASLSALPPPLCPSRLRDVAAPPRLIYSFNNAESYVNSRSAPEMEVYESRRAEPSRWRQTGTQKILKALLFPWWTGMHWLTPPHPTRLCDNVCEYELVSRRFKILLYFYQRSLIPLAAGNKKCHCHSWQGRGAGSRYSIKAIIKNEKKTLPFERQRSSMRQRSAVPPLADMNQVGARAAHAVW